MILALSVGILMAGAVYLMMRPDMFRITIGFVMLSHAANLVFMSAGGVSWRGEPFGAHDDTTGAADPLPQAFVLTAIVISFSITIVMLISSVIGKPGDATRADDDVSRESPRRPDADDVDELYHELAPDARATPEVGEKTR
ncbi:sodium:proton antiporter [Corynebacterium sanguinis]|uniref:sodium:proton antiporter n=1 Tax=Corynebacterium TaxID=1716 RepID=UPI0011A5ECF6|nr:MULTISPECIES: cation:proton antiporter subunit C [Corynebacterium]MCT1415020.1 cation:proton antiporter subunit C [Corynebacterium sanguinis]MCT1584868.1 cation:proton antiporter subunit C [Corynebacterium sanguinis]MCT1805779.1 cation:proton antiporter subunit C [Corynebacterium sanguinis]MCT2023813.1 cation:proton antiporter subunit C [Corynebacterium sanguinis]MCT2047758.1 cation:proton antiporter subunit C [Corynebacterium sanguinis]